MSRTPTRAGSIVNALELVELPRLRTVDDEPVVVLVAPTSARELLPVLKRLPGEVPDAGELDPAKVSPELVEQRIAQARELAPVILPQTTAFLDARGVPVRPAFYWNPDDAVPGVSIPGWSLTDRELSDLLVASLIASGYIPRPPASADGKSEKETSSELGRFPDGDGAGRDRGSRAGADRGGDGADAGGAAREPDGARGDGDVVPGGSEVPSDAARDAAGGNA